MFHLKFHFLLQNCPSLLGSSKSYGVGSCAEYSILLSAFVVTLAMFSGCKKEEAAPETPVVDHYSVGIKAYEQKDASGLEQQIAALDPAVVSERGQQLVLQAMAHLLKQESQSALDLLHEAAKYDSIRARALSMAGSIMLFERRDAKTGEELLKAALSADPEFVDPYRNLAAWYYDIGAMDDALFNLKKVTELDLEDARPWRMRGMILADFERHAEAIPAYEEALKRNLASNVAAEVRQELAGSLLAARRPEEALVQLEQCAENAAVLSLIADCQLALGDLDAADTALEQSLQLSPRHPRSLMLKSSVARERGDLQAAADVLQQAVDWHPYEFDFRFHLMSAYNALGEPEKAKIHQVEMERLRDLRTKFTELHHASMQDPESADIRFELGETAEKLGKYQMAVSWYQAALTLSPGHEQAQQALSRITEAATGQP